jgi:hypothetical protein
VVARQVSCGSEGGILAHTKVCNVVQFCKYVKMSCGRGLYLGKLLAKILQKSFLQTATGLYRLLSNETEALIKFRQDLLGSECPGLQRLLDLRTALDRTSLSRTMKTSFGVLTGMSSSSTKLR